MPSLRTLSKRVAGNLVYYDDVLSPTSSLWNSCPLLAIREDPSLAFVFEEDFFTFTTGESGLAAVTAEGGTAAITAATAGIRGGVLKITAGDGGDNDEVYVGSENKDWILASGKDIWFEARVRLDEQNTDDMNFGVGLCSQYSADTLQNNGAGPAANYDGVLFFKVDGGTVWNLENSQAGNQTTTATTLDRQNATWVRLGFHIVGTDRIEFYVNGSLAGTHSTNLPTAAMGLFVGAKNGDTNNEIVYVDYIKCVQLR